MNPLKEMKVTSPFGPRNAPIKGASTKHSGIDLKANYIDCFACDNGVVKEVSEWKPGIGKYIIIDHEGYCSTYGHLNNFKVSKNQIVKEGDVIAQTGNSGNSEAPHLHFEIRNKPYGTFNYWEKNSEGYYMNAVDPIEFLNNLKKEDLQVTEVLYKGKSGPNVMWLHLMLKKDGYLIIPDGRFGDYTKSLVKKFQKNNGLYADGVVGPNTTKKLKEVEARKFTITYYDKQTYFVTYQKNETKLIDIVKSKYEKGETLTSINNRLSPKPDTLSNGNFFNMADGGSLGETFEEGVRYGYNAYDPLVFVVTTDLKMQFLMQEESRKLKNIKDSTSFSPMMFYKGNDMRGDKRYGTNLTKDFLEKKLEPRHVFFETQNLYIEVFVNGRNILKGYKGLKVTDLFLLCTNIAAKYNERPLNGGNLDGGYSLAEFIDNKLRTDTYAAVRPLTNGIAFYMK